MPFRFLRTTPPDTPPAGTVSTFTLLRFPLRHTWWALAYMGQSRMRPSPPGALFSRMLGCGRNGFSVVPDLGRYALLISWESTEAALQYFRSDRYNTLAARTSEAYSILMAPVQSHGMWNGRNPFATPSPAQAEAGDPLLVLTRATIATNRLWEFLRQVPTARSGLRNSPGLLYAQGIGENPLTQQATLSIWENSAALRYFAYEGTAHKDIVRRTRERKWYREELFARFLPLATSGTLDGRDLLDRYFPQLEEP
jgi:heme-degrading monooxygenase HmoA